MMIDKTRVRFSRWARLTALLLLLAGFATEIGSIDQVVASPNRSMKSVAREAQWAWPIEPPHLISRPFIAPETVYSSGHRGIDIEATLGATVYSPQNGTVFFSGMVVDRSVLSIKHGSDIVSSYEPVISTLVPGDIVQRGDALGALEAGHCDRACLHFGVRTGGRYVSPLKYLGEISRSVLLPTRHVD